jgi:hypothetical protein
MDLDFVCFQEAILQDFSESCLRAVDPSQNFLWDWLPTRGRSGGMLSGFKIDKFDVGRGSKENLYYSMTCGIRI